MAVWRSSSAAVSALDTCSASVTGIRTALACAQSVQAAAPRALLPLQAALLPPAVLLPLVVACLPR